MTPKHKYTCCPKCGSADGVGVNLRTQGSQYVHYNFNGEADYCNQDALRFTQPKYGRCLKCDKRIPNPRN